MKTKQKSWWLCCLEWTGPLHSGHSRLTEEPWLKGFFAWWFHWSWRSIVGWQKGWRVGRWKNQHWQKHIEGEWKEQNLFQKWEIHYQQTSSQLWSRLVKPKTEPERKKTRWRRRGRWWCIYWLPLQKLLHCLDQKTFKVCVTLHKRKLLFATLDVYHERNI